MILGDRKVNQLMDGLKLPESPRWHDGLLWFSDMFAGQVMTVDLNGHSTVVAEFPDSPSGLGFLPDGTPLVVLMSSRKIVRLEPNGTQVHADLNQMPGGSLNDMVVAPDGRAYVDSYPRRGAANPGSYQILLVDPTGETRIAADGERDELVNLPNGLGITSDQKTLIFSSTEKCQLCAMTIDDDGLLSSSRVFADTPGISLDGLCLDAEGAVWVGGIESNTFLRVRDGGQVEESISVGDRMAVACLLGGPDRRTLFLMSSRYRRGDPREGAIGFIDVVTVDVPGAGWP